MPSPALLHPSADAATTPVKTRRSHRKSRNGCFECKRRHIRCDEARPACTNCSIAERNCAYPAKAKASLSTMLQSQAPPPPPMEAYAPTTSPAAMLTASMTMPLQTISPTNSSSSGERLNLVDQVHNTYSDYLRGSLPSISQLHHSSTSSAAPAVAREYTYAHQHMALLHHIERNMDGCVFAPGTTAVLVDFAIRCASFTPYVMDQMLAVSALHFSRLLPPTEAGPWRRMATELQTRSLTSYTNDVSVIPDDLYHCGQRFLFASLLGIHVQYEVLQTHHDSFEVLVDRFASAMHAYRGVTVVSLPVYLYLNTTELEPLLRTTREAHERMVSGSECQPLFALLESKYLTPADFHVLTEAISLLQDSFNLARSLGPQDAQHAAANFSIRAPQAFVYLLQRMVPEALVMLAWHGILMHRARSYWVYRHTGDTIIRATADYLGGQYADLLQWPLHVVDTEKT